MNSPANLIDQLCDEFESQLAAGEPVRAEQFLDRVSAEHREFLLTELVGLELDYRSADGLGILRQELQQRFPYEPAIALIAGAQDTQALLDDDTLGAASVDVPRSSFGDYEIVQEIARGGMGVVYEALHRDLGRRVALKCILSSYLSSPEAVRRFENEARAAARLSHPNIVPVYEVGEADGDQFFAMALVQGETLADRLKRGPLPTREAARLMAAIGQGIAHAHVAGVVHRDLKPANIIIDTDGSPRITDFGLAKQVEDGGNLTITGQILGTPSYMSPEQARGDVDNVGKLTDVYALGAILYATLTGRPPFQAATIPATVQQVLQQEPLHPHALDRTLPRDLCTISLQALQKDPTRRYPSASAFVDDIQRFLDHRPIVARRASMLERSVRWMRRNRALAAGIAAMLGAIAVLGTGTFAVNRERQIAETNRLAAEAQSTLANENFGTALRAVDEYFTKIGDDTLLNEPGMEPLRKKLLIAASGFYKDIVERGLPAGAQQHQESWKLLVDAMLKQALIVEATEPTPVAMAHFEKIIAKIEEVGDLDQDVEWIEKLLRTRSSLALAQVAMGDFETARVTIEAGDELFERARQLGSHSLELAILRSQMLSALGDYWDRKGDLDRCREITRQTEEVLAAAGAQHTVSWALLNRRARATGSAGIVELKAGDYERALAKFEAAEQFCAEGVRLEPENANARWLRSAMLKLQGQSLGNLLRRDEAHERYAAAITELERLTRDFPLAARFQKELAGAYTSYGQDVMDGGDISGGLQISKQGLAAWEVLVARFPRPDFQKRLAITHNTVAHGYRKLDDFAQAEVHALAGIEIATALASVVDPEPRNVSDLGHMRSQLGSIYMDTAREEDALLQYLAAWELMSEYAPAHRELIDVVFSYAAAANGLAGCYRQLGEEEQALELYQTALPLLFDTRQTYQGDRINHYLHSNYMGQGRAAYQLGRVEDAAIAFAEAERFATTAARTITAQYHQWMMLAEQGGYQAQFEQVTKLVEEESELHFKAATYVAGACCNGVSNDQQSSPEQRDRLLAKYQDQCLVWLTELQAANGLSTHFERKQLTLYPAFDALRDHPSFVALVEASRH